MVGYSRGVAIHYSLGKGLFSNRKCLSLKKHPTNPTKESSKIRHTFYSHIQLEALDWFEESQVLIGFQDGSTATWTLVNELTENSKNGDILYGPMPCKPITKVNKVNDLKVRFLFDYFFCFVF